MLRQKILLQKTLTLAASVLFISACSKSPDSQNNESGLTHVIIQTDWYAQPEHGGFYQAVALGYYADEGLEVEIRPGANLNTIPQLVASGRVNFAVGALERMFIYRSMDIPLVSLFPYFQHDPQCVLFHTSSGITSLQDLDGREVMFQAGLIYTDFIESSLGISLHLLPMDWSLARFAQDENFVQQCFLTSEPLVVRRQGIDASVIPMSESGFDPYRHVYTTEQQIADDPELVAAFTRASLKGWKDFMSDDPMPAFELIMQSNPQQTIEIMTEIRDEMLHYNLTEGNAAKGEELGQYNKARIRKMLSQLAELGLLRDAVDIESGVAWQLLPPDLIKDTE